MGKNANGSSLEFTIHPGETLREVLEDRGMSQRELSIRTDVTESHVSSLVNCRKAISVSYAKKLEYALGIDADFWINLQANYERELADLAEISGVCRQELGLLDDLKDIAAHLKARGFLEQGAYGPVLVIHLRKLLGVSSLLRIPAVAQAGAYRLAAVASVNPYILFTWLRMCDLIVKDQQMERRLDVDRLVEKLPLIKELMFAEEAEIQSKLKTHLAECGIRFSVVKHFQGAPVQGFIKRNGDGTLSLLMTTRQKFADIFWFTFFHEIGHIVNGHINDKLVDYDFATGEREDAADSFAANLLIDASAYETFVKTGRFTLPAIRMFSAEQNVPPYIPIGRLQRDGHIGYSWYQKEKVKYEAMC